MISILVVLPLVGSTGCEPCEGRPVPCADERFYELYPDPEPERPSGPATVTLLGSDTVRLTMVDTGEGVDFRSLPQVPPLEVGQEVMVNGGSVSRDGELVFFSGSGPELDWYGPQLVAGVEVGVVPFCREQLTGGEDQCFYGTTVYSIEVGGEEIEPGAIREVELPDGRRATFHNRLVNRGSGACPGCADLPPANFRIDVVFH